MKDFSRMVEAVDRFAEDLETEAETRVVHVLQKIDDLKETRLWQMFAGRDEGKRKC